MSLSDVDYYARKEIDDQRRRNAVSMASKRGKAAVMLFDGGFKLTKETQPTFNKLMKRVNKCETMEQAEIVIKDFLKK